MRILSTRSDVVLEFRAPREDFVEVSITRQDLTARSRVEVSIDVDGIAKFFRSMSDEWRGWSGSKSWVSLERDLRLTASHDSLGHVFLRVELSRDSGAPDPWKVDAGLTLEAGALERIAEDAEALFSRDPL